MSQRRGRGTTLIELMVTLAVMGFLAALAAVAVGALRPPPTDARSASLAAARARAIQSGRPVRSDDGSPVLFLPDGRATGQGVDPLTGTVIDAR